jgi:predicted acetyltransferase
MRRFLDFSHLHIWVKDVDAFKEACVSTLGWRTSHYAPGIMVMFQELPKVAFENGFDSKFQIGVRTLQAAQDTHHLMAEGLKLERELTTKPDGRVQSWFAFLGNVSLELEESFHEHIDLVEPSMVYRASYCDGIREYHQEKRRVEIDPDMDEEAFLDHLESLKSKKWESSPSHAATSTWWAVSNGVYLGSLRFRHTLNVLLGQKGGHIGYEVRPAFRNKGVAKTMLKLVKPHLQTLGAWEALITCNAENEASEKVALSVGARYVGVFSPADGSPNKKHFLWDLSH